MREGAKANPQESTRIHLTLPVLSLAGKHSRPKIQREVCNPLHRRLTFWIDEGWLSSQAHGAWSHQSTTQTLQNHEKDSRMARAESRGKVAGPNGAAARLLEFRVDARLENQTTPT